MDYTSFASLLAYHPQQPMLFTNFLFWLFFAVVLAGYSLLYRRSFLRTAFLFGVSLFFYYKSGGAFFWLLVFSTLVDYVIGLFIWRSASRHQKRLWLIASLMVNIGVLAYFKYTFFIVDTLNVLTGSELTASNVLAAFANAHLGTALSVDTIILPVGISFYTFQTMSYSIDIYRGRLEPVTNIIDFGFYVSFFPQLVAGPIVRASEFIPQIRRAYSLSMHQFGYAIFMIINGLIKKMVISDYLSVNFVDRIFESPESFTGLENLIAVYAYAFQIYCDFSGYTDIAIGVALLLGFHLPINFMSPYRSTDITEFWRRWHISLSTWLRDYVYISLGGNRRGRLRTYFHLLATMLIGGLWHGANIRFVIWGGLHGAGLAVHKLWMEAFGKLDSARVLYTIASWLLTFHFVCFAWIFFRAESLSQAWVMLEKIVFYFSPHIFPQFFRAYLTVILLILSAFAIHIAPARWKNAIREQFISAPIWVKALICIAAAVCMYQFKSSDAQAFIYFQF